MLAYLFWHSPAPSASSYQDHLRAFHQALILNAPDGFLSSASFRVAGLAWLPDTECYEDWYLVQDFSSLGFLNEAAVSGHRKDPHDQVAAQAGWGAGGLYALVRGSANIAGARYSAWFKRPAGVPYAAFFDAIGREYPWEIVSLWQRQMVLGPALEFCLLSSQPLALSHELFAMPSRLERIA